MNRSYKVIWNQSLNCFMAVAEYAKSRGKSSSHVVSSTSTASAAVSSGARLLRLSSLTVALAATGMTLSSQVFAETGTLGGSSSQASSTAISPTTAQCGPLTEATIAGTATNSTAIGCGTTITSAPDSVAIGRQNTVTATNSNGQQITERRGGTDPRLYPTGAISYLGTAVAIGNTNSVGAAGGVALGNNNQVTGGFHGIALGQGNLTSGSYAVGLGIGNLSSGVSSVAVGTANEATGNTAIALGRQTYSRADSGIAAGNIATVEAGATNGIALGTSANVAAAGVNSVAVGANANATITNSVALGSGSTTTAPSGNSFLTNVAAVPANGVVSVGSATANRRIQNVAGGSAATDAVNVAQLTQQNTLTNKQGTDTAAALGGNSTYTAATGAVSAPSYSLNNGTVTATNVGAALSSIDGRTINNTANIATNATNITGLQSQTFRLRANTDPATAVGSNDTVTFLDGSNVNITRTGNNVTIGTSLTPTFTTVTSTGAMNAGGALTVTGASNLNGGANLNNNKITGLAKGTNATDAVNFSQLAESELTSSVVAGNNTSVSSATTGNNTAYTVNAKKSTVSAGSTAVAVTPGTEANDTTNYAVDLSTATKASLVRADTAVQTVSSNDSNLTAVKTGNNVAFDFADAPVFTGQVKANGFDASGAKIVNVADGTAATDAATFGQLTTANTKTDALGTSTAANLGGDAAYNATTGAVSAPAYSLNNGTVTANTVGGALTNLDGRTTTNTTNIATNTADIAKGFNIKAGSSAVDNVKLGETVGFTNTDNNLVITNNGTDNTVNYNLAQNLNLGATGSLLTGNTRVNNAGITVTGGTNDTVLLSRNGLNNGNNVITNVANGVAATDAATFGQLSTTNINVATNTSNIANVRAQANRGFNISADNSDLVNNETVDNVQLGETVDFTNTDGNLVATVSNNGINYDLADDISVDSVTADDGNGKVTTLNATGTNVTDGINTSDYTANGFSTTDGTNTTTFNQSGLSFADANGATGPSITAAGINAGNQVITNVASAGDYTDAANANNATNAGDLNAAVGGLTDLGLSFAGDSGTDVQRKLGQTLDITGGSTGELTTGNIGVVANGVDGLSVQLAKDIDLGVDGSVKTGNTVTNNTGLRIDDGTNITAVTATGTNVTDGTNTSSYSANGLSINNGPSITATGIDSAGNKITNIADATNAGDAVNFGQLQAANGAAAAKMDALGNSTADNLGGGAMYTPATGTVSAPNYTLDDGSNTGTNVTANNVGDALNNLDGRTTTNTSNIANVQAQANQGFNISAAGGTADNVQLGETVDFTNTDGNLVVSSNGANGINYNLAENIDLGANGSLKTGNTTTNNAGVRIDDGTNITAVTATGTNVTDGVNSSNYGANGFTIVGGPSVTTAGINAGNRTISNLADGVAATDAATKGQVDAVATGLTDLTAGAVKYDRNADNTINKNSVTFEGTPAVIGQDDDGNNVVVSGGTRLSNVANGINTADAVNKGQLDSSIAQNVTKVEVNDQNGNPVTVNITDQVVNRNIDNSNMDSLFLTYNVEGQGITDRLTIGETVQKMNTEGVKFAHTKAVSAKGDLGITNDSSAGGDNSTAIGVNAIIQEGADSTVALGHNTEASANATNSVVIGKDSQVTGQSSIAIGNGAQALGNQSISIGTGNIVNGNNSGAFGDPSIINGDNSYSVGNNNTINSNDTFVLGNNVTSTVGGSVVLGTGSAARTGAGIAGYGATGNAAITATTSTTGAVAVGDATNGIYRQVTGVAAGTADSDAVNVSQLKAVSDTLQSNNEALSNAAVQYDKNADGTVNKGSITLGGGAAGTTITNVAAGNISAGSTDAVNGSQLHNLGNGVAGIIGGDATFDASGNLTASNIGGTGKGNISDAIAAVNQGNAQANENIQANKDRLDAGLSFGADSGATINKPIGDTTALKFEGGNNITTTATSSGIKFDLNGNIDVDNITADKVTTGNTTVSNSGVTIKDGPSMTAAGINAGDKTITGVADGIEVNDAVNLGQLTALDNKLSNSVNELGYKINEVEDDANAGISAAMAMSSLPQAYIPGKSMVGGGIATYNGQSAVAIGVSKVSDNGRWVIKVNGTADTQGNAGGAVGAGFHF